MQVVVTDSAGCVGTSAIYSLTINACPTIHVTNPTVACGTAGLSFNQSFGHDATAGPFIVSLASGTLPEGITLSNDGVLSGTPMHPGSSTITVKTTDVNGCSGTGSSYTLLIKDPPITVTNPPTVAATLGTAFTSQPFTQVGGLGTTTFSIATGTLPSWASLSSSGVLSGTPTTEGSFTITVKATDSNGSPGFSAPYTFTAACPAITVSVPSTTSGMLGVAFSQSFGQSQGVGAVSYSVASGNVPLGLTLSSAGLLSGLPIQTGTFTMTVAVTDINGCVGTAPYELTIDASSSNGTMSADYLDSDGDGIPDALEVLAGSDPFLWDSNNDGIADGLQATSGDGTYQIMVFSPGVRFGS